MKEQNRLIAEFMGYETHPNQDLAFKVKTTGNEKGTINLNLVKYNSSWDWLMPVVEKIELMGYDILILPDKDSWFSDFSDLRMKVRGNRNTGKTKIESTYKTVIEFIKWYNQQNQAQ